MPDEGSDNGFKYWAFISYSHADKPWGDWLHRALETYRVPKRLVGTPSLDGKVPARLFPVFRDREELPVSASLPENINRALEQSRYLIVICSPRAAASRWVNEEIKTFKGLGREDRVLAVIVAGEPNASEDGGKPGWRTEDECFPPALRYRWGGNGELSNERAEPLAADTRADKDGKPSAKLKLLAGLLRVNYDQLRQREHERRVRQLSYLVTGALVLLAIFAGLAVYSEMQRRKAEQATTTAQQRTAEALEANRKTKAQIHQACAADLAAARNLLDKGNWREALMHLRRAQSYDDADSKLASIWLWSEVVYGQGDRDKLPQILLCGEENFSAAVYSPDGTRILTASEDKTAQQWDANTGDPVGGPLLLRDAVLNAAYSPDGTRIVTACNDSTAQQWDAATGKPINTSLPHEGPVICAVYSPDGTRLVTGCGDGNAQQWETSTGRPIGKPLPHEAMVFSVAYSPDGTRIVTGCGDGNAQQWETSTGRPIGRPLNHEETVLGVAYSPDGTRIVTASEDGTARQWETATGQALGEALRHGSVVRSAAYSPDGLRIVTTCNDGAARQWEAATGTPMGIPLHHEDTVNSAVYSPDGTRIVTASEDKTVRQWDAVTDPMMGEPLYHEAKVWGAAYSPDGTRIVTGCDDGNAQQWETATGKPINTPLRHKKAVRHVACSPNGLRIITASEDGSVQQWDIATGETMGKTLHHSGVISCAYSPDGARIVTAGGDNTARQWDAVSGKPVGEPLPHDNTVVSAVYSPDGLRIVTACYVGPAQQWEAATGRPIGEPLNHQGIITSASYNPDGTRVVTTSGDSTAQQWDEATCKSIGEPLRHARGYVVQSAAYSPDGTRIVTACDSEAGGIAQQWEAATGRPIGEPLRHRGEIWSAVYSPDGARIVTSSSDGTARQWQNLLPSSLPPKWLDEFVQMLAGLRFDDNGELQRLAVPQRLALRAALLTRPGIARSSSDNWERLARWAMTPTSLRSYTPNSTRSTMEIAAHDLTDGQQPSVEDAVRLAPDLPLAHLALAAFPNYASNAGFLRRYELARLPPSNTPLRLRAAAMLRAQQQPRLALQALEEIRTDAPPDVDRLAGLTLTRWLSGDKNGAVRDCQRLISADTGYIESSKIPAVAAMSDDDKTALLAAIAETLRRHPELAPKRQTIVIGR